MRLLVQVMSHIAIPDSPSCYRIRLVAPHGRWWLRVSRLMVEILSRPSLHYFMQWKHEVFVTPPIRKNKNYSFVCGPWRCRIRSCVIDYSSGWMKREVTTLAKKNTKAMNGKMSRMWNWKQTLSSCCSSTETVKPESTYQNPKPKYYNWWSSLNKVRLMRWNVDTMRLFVSLTVMPSN